MKKLLVKSKEELAPERAKLYKLMIISRNWQKSCFHHSNIKNSKFLSNSQGFCFNNRICSSRHSLRICTLSLMGRTLTSTLLRCTPSTWTDLRTYLRNPPLNLKLCPNPRCKVCFKTCSDRITQCRLMCRI